jgi:hypothetical protein
MQPVSDLFRSERKLTGKPPIAKALVIVGVDGGGGDGTRYTEARRDMANRSSGAFRHQGTVLAPTNAPLGGESAIANAGVVTTTSQTEYWIGARFPHSH